MLFWIQDGGKQQLTIQEKVDVDKPSLEEDVITQHNTDVTSQGYKGEEVNAEVQYARQDDPGKLSNNLGRNVKIA